MRQWDHGGGISLTAAARIEATDRKGLESQGQGLALLGAERMQRLLRYCVCPIYTGERMEWAKPGECLIYRLPKPRPDGQTTLTLTPLEWLDRVAVLIPPAIGIMASWRPMPHCVRR